MTRVMASRCAAIWLVMMAAAPQAGWATDDEFYYRVGGGEALTRAPSNRSETIEIGGGVSWNTDLMCGNFDMSVSVQEQLDGLKGSFNKIMGDVIDAATGAVASLPALIIQKANPALYDLLQNGVLQASEEFNVARASCEDMVGVMDDVISGGGWESASRVGYWAGESNSGSELLATRDGANGEGLDAGVTWVAGSKRGGRDQAAVSLIGDTAKAGYNQVLRRDPDSTSSTTSTCADAPICEQWASPQAFSDWLVAVIGERKIRTCEGCDKVATQAGMGLTHQLGIEQTQILADLETLVASGAAPTADELDKVSGGPGLRVTRRVIEAIREEPSEGQAMVINRLANEMALSRTMERAMMARRALLAGMKEPNIANLAIAQEELRPYVAELEQEIENILYELEIREKIATNTMAELIVRERVRNAVPIVESPPGSQFEDGATVEP